MNDKPIIKTIAATDINSFNELINEAFLEGYRFAAGQHMQVTPHRDATGYGMQYTVLLILDVPIPPAKPNDTTAG